MLYVVYFVIVRQSFSFCFNRAFYVYYFRPAPYIVVTSFSPQKSNDAQHVPEVALPSPILKSRSSPALLESDIDDEEETRYTTVGPCFTHYMSARHMYNPWGLLQLWNFRRQNYLFTFIFDFLTHSMRDYFWQIKTNISLHAKMIYDKSIVLYQA